MRLHEEFKSVETLWDDPAYWVTASGKPVNQTNAVTTYKEKFQQLIDIHIKNMKARDAKAQGRWLPTHDFTINALDETPDIAFLTYSEKFHQGTNPQVKTRKIDASYNKHNKRYKVRTFLDGKLVSTETGDEFNNLMDYLCWRFLGPKLGTTEYDSLMEWVDNQGQKVSFGPNNQAPTNKTTQTATQTTQPTANKASKPPAPVVARGVAKRKQVKNKFGILIDNWGPELTKLGLHIWDTCQKPADEKDSGVGPDILRIYFVMPNGEEWRLEVTNTGIKLNKGIQVYVDWDYVISTDRNGKEIIISRGKTKDYNEFLDILLKEGIISDKKKCV